MIELLVARQAAVLIASALGAYTDAKTGYIYDWVTLPLIAIGIALNVVEQNFFGILIGAAIFAAGYAFYFTGKFGGGDVKLFAGIAMAIPFQSGTLFIFPVVLFAALGAVVFYGTLYTLKYARKGIKWKDNEKGVRRALLMGALMAIYFLVLLQAGFVSFSYTAFFAVPLLFALTFLALENGIRKEFFLKRISVKELEEDEIIAFDFMSESEKEKFQKIKGIIGTKEILWLGEKGFREIPVYRNLPRFGPFIFLGVLIAIALPDAAMFVMGGGA